MAADPSAPPEPARWIKLRASAAERARWQALAASRGVSLSELIRASLGGLRLRTRQSTLFLPVKRAGRRRWRDLARF